MWFCVVWWHDEQCLDDCKSGTWDELFNEPDSRLLIKSWWIAFFLEFCQIVTDKYRIWPVKYLLLHFIGKFVWHLLHLSFNIVILSLRLVFDSIRTVINGRLVPFAERYYSFEHAFGKFCICDGVLGAMMTEIFNCFCSFPRWDCDHDRNYPTHL